MVFYPLVILSEMKDQTKKQIKTTTLTSFH